MPVPSVEDELRRHNQVVLHKITDAICVDWGQAVLKSAAITSLGMAMLWFGGDPLFRSLSNAERGAEWLSPLGVTTIAFAATFLYLQLRAAKLKSSTFARALGQIAEVQDRRHHYLIRRIIAGGKIAEVLETMGVEDGDEVSVMWSFFYREEQTSELLARCKRDKLRLRILLIAPDAEGLRQRMQDIEGNYRDNVESVFKQVSLSNSNFAETVQRQINRDPRLKNRIQVRVADRYVGRPIVIVKGRSPGILRSLWLMFELFLVRSYAKEVFSPVRVAMGMYMAREASAYPFVEFHSDRLRSDVSLISRDIVDMFEARWTAARRIIG